MVALASSDARSAVQIDDERILWDAEYRREVIQRLKRLEQARVQAREQTKAAPGPAPASPSRAA